MTTDIGFGPAMRRYIMSGVYNGDFYLVPDSPDATITTANDLPYWTFTQSSGTAITCKSLADTGSASGRVIQFQMAAGAAGDDSYLEQTVPVNGSRSQTYAYRTAMASRNPSSTAIEPETYISRQYLKADGVTTTGSSSTFAFTWDAGFYATYGVVDIAPTTIVVPADAYWLRVRVGLRRAGAANSDTGTVDFCEVSIAADTSDLHLPDQLIPSNGLAVIGQSEGDLTISNNGFANGRIILFDNAASTIQVRGPSEGLSFEAAVLLFPETSAPGAITDVAKLYGRDNGAGKTQLVVRFGTGAIQVLATEP